MKAAIVEEAHNHVVWETKSSIIWTELGLLVAGICVSILLVTTPSPARWTLIGIASALVLGVGVVLALATPLAERGELERPLDSGMVRRTKRWLLLGKRLTWEAPLESIAGFRLETRAFEETGDRTYSRTRLLAVIDGGVVPLTDWLDDAFIQTLGESLARAGRCEFEAT